MTEASDALAAARLLAAAPALGGMLVRGGALMADALIATVMAALPAGAPLRRLPVSIDDERLSGGLDLAATLASGAPVHQPGLLAAVAGGLLVVPMAERLSDGVAARLAAALDGDDPASRFVVLAFDDSVDDDDQVAPALAERLALHVDLAGVRPVEAMLADPVAPRAVAAVPDVLEALAATSAMLGIASMRAPVLALRAARSSAAGAGRATVEEADVALAARLVLGPRATCMPPTDNAPEAPEQAPPPPPDSAPEDDANSTAEPPQLDDLVLAAALASLPKGLLADLARGGARRAPAPRGRGKGERRRAPTRGRPVGSVAGVPRGGLRLSLIDTLRAAAPWQRLRGAAPGDKRVRVRRDDLRIRRFENRAEATTIFAVDASGSAALTRLAEAKGAVELLLAEAYVKRAQVALIAFRGTEAALLLPPTRSLVRAKRSLADMAGGGGTPLAAGLRASAELALDARKRGRTPFLVVLTDGRANIAADGTPNRTAANDDALAAARAIAAAGLKGAFIDISPSPRPEGERIAAAMGARYLPLPRADAARMHAAVKASLPC
ncbi:magnesium chelatase subunit D [Sphingomonas sp. GlSt437]|uniref:magnesium chelatase subunit D n=1 Tax=Sphingomonas sp. GlSt437 TaxID=3389970 RepID=UPI003A89FC73